MEFYSVAHSSKNIVVNREISINRTVSARRLILDPTIFLWTNLNVDTIYFLQQFSDGTGIGLAINNKKGRLFFLRTDLNHLFKQLQSDSDVVVQLIHARIITPGYNYGVGKLMESSDSGRALKLLEITCSAVIKKAKTNLQNIKKVKGCESDLVSE